MIKVKKNLGKQFQQVPTEEIKGFFTYQWYNQHIQNISMEWDSLIIMPQSKLIINIEVKNGPGLNPLKSAAKQTNIHSNIFLKIFGSILSTNWKFVKATCNPNLESNSLACDICKQFIITEDEFNNLEPWIRKIKSTKSYAEENFKEEYENLLVQIIGFSSLRDLDKLCMQDKLIDPHELSKKAEGKLTAVAPGIQGENEDNRHLLQESGIQNSTKLDYLCYMLTAEQLNAVKDPSTHIIIEGDYGCGKTYVLKERAKICAEKNPNSQIAYINLTTSELARTIKYKKTSLSIMDLIAYNNFKDYDNIDVVTCRGLYLYHKEIKDELTNEGNNTWGSVLKSFIKQNSYSHIFVDEIPKFTRTKNIIDFFDKGISFCVTLRRDKESTMIIEWIKQMKERYNAKIILFNFNMRNTETIVNVSKLFKENDKVKVGIPRKNITGPICYSYCNEQYQYLYLLYLARAAVNKYFKDKPKEPVVVLTYNYVREIYEDLHTNFSADRNVVYLPDYSNEYDQRIDEVKRYLNNPEGILIANIENFHGAQARNIILLGEDSKLLRDMIMRTMSFAIIIHKKELEKTVPGLVKDTNLHEYIYLGNTAPKCYVYNNVDGVDENVLATAIINRFSDCSKPILIITDDFGEISSQRLKYDTSRHVEYIPAVALTTRGLKAFCNKSIEGSILLIDFFTYHKKLYDNLNEWTDNFREFENIVILLNDKKSKFGLELYHYNDIYDYIRNLIMATASQAVIVHDGTGAIDHFKPLKMEEIKDLHAYAELPESLPSSIRNSVKHIDEYCGPVCNHYNNVNGVHENILARAIIRKFLDYPTQNILILTYDCGENVSKGLKQHTSRNVEYFPIQTKERILFETMTMFFDNFSQGSIVVIDFLKYCKVLYSEWYSILIQFENVVIFLEDIKASNVLNTYKENIMCIKKAILRTAPFAIIVHYGTDAIDHFKPLKMEEIKDLHEYADILGSLPSSARNSEVENFEVVETPN